MDENRVTLDPNVEIPEDAPLAQGHKPEDAEAARDAQQALKEQVQAEAEQPEVGPRAAGDHAEEAKKQPSKKSEKSD